MALMAGFSRGRTWHPPRTAKFWGRKMLKSNKNEHSVFNLLLLLLKTPLKAHWYVQYKYCHLVTFANLGRPNLILIRNIQVCVT